MSEAPPQRILMVCMGNICRSPLAECVFRHKIRERGVERRFVVDSAGTGGWHAGEPPDFRVLQTAARHNIAMSGLARQVKREDFARFDLLVCMDRDNHAHLAAMGAPADRLRLLMDYAPDAAHDEVPDPYYGGEEGFETVYGLVDAACDRLLDALLARRA